MISQTQSVVKQMRLDTTFLPRLQLPLQNRSYNIHMQSPKVTNFQPISPEALSKLVFASKPTTCLLDPLPAKLFEDLWPSLGPTVLNILRTVTVPTCFKTAVVKALLTGPVCRIQWHLVVRLQIETNRIPLPSPHPLQACRRTYGGCHFNVKCERPSLEPVFGLSVLGYCRNMLCGRGPAPYADYEELILS